MCSCKMVFKYREYLFTRVHEIVFFGQGGYDWDTVYNMPIMYRDFIYNQIRTHYEKQSKDAENQQKANNTSYFFGMLFGLFYNLTLLYFMYDLVEKGFRSFALKLFIINATIIIGSFGLLTFSRRFSSKKPNQNKNHPRRYNKSQNTTNPY